MEHDTQEPQWNNSDQNSFAHQSARDRWPIILTGAIDDVHKAVGKATDKDVEAEGKSIISQLATLKYELQHNRQLTPLPDDGHPDIARYNTELQARSPLHWHTAPWLFSECYLYRRMCSIFHLSTHWKSYDHFATIKNSTFRSSRAAVLELATKYNTIISQLRSPPPALANASPEDKKKADLLLFTEMCEICLWGNATDLSLLASASYVDIASLQGAEARKKAEKNILVNDVGRAFEALQAAKDANPSGERRVDIVLDNSGFELFVDVVLAGYLLHANLATVVVFHPKTMPWFVSDVVPKDFAKLFEVLLNAKQFYETPSEEDVAKGTQVKALSGEEERAVKELSEDWTRLYAEGKFVLRPNGFWSEGGSFWRLPAEQRTLCEDLKEAELVVFKGDLNYRKLTADAMWHPTTPFEKAVGPLGPGSGLRILSLRTCKGDVVVGLPEGKDEELKAMDGGGGDSVQ
ncbi:Protein-glutamate O-methyltransferase [Elsinoe australis]|uniref:Sugar phosphate phosphatase n=1 Tax=Elsinoe australis TaxID=40998 RepID=A0A2P7ZXY1_9PEZI|nr:Protein-glutamate O-methyltransferase [Elsinoe australis]